MSNQIRPICWVVIITVGAIAGCGGGPTEEELALQQAQEQLTTVRQAYGDLQQLRVGLDAAEVGLAEIEAIDEKKRTDEQKAQLEELTAEIQRMSTSAEETYDGLQVHLANFLTIALNDFPLSPETAEALTIYSEEAILVADDIVLKSGDYKKAINHLAGAKGYYEAIEVEVYPVLVEKMAELNDWSFITKERFDEVKKGMTADEVKAVAGTPYYGNMQEDKKKGIETWLFKKREGGAAAIYFKMKTGKVYSTKFDAVKIKVVQE